MSAPEVHRGSMEGMTVPGLLIEQDFISEAQERELVDIFRHRIAWPEDRKGRLAVHYGHTFSYRTMGIDPDVPFIDFPDWLVAVLPRPDNGRRPDQVCLQYYKPGTGIPPHADTHSIYDELFALSVGAPVLMDFKRAGEEGAATETVEVDLLPRSMIQMTADARLHYTHGIKKRKRDIVGGEERLREDRWSVTFRWLRGGECECGNARLCDTAQRRLGIEKTFRWQEEVPK